MPSERPPADRGGRRRFLAALGTTLTATVAGCSGRVPGTGPNRIDAETTTEAGSIVWEYPPEDAERAEIGYGKVSVERPPEKQFLEIRLNSTVGPVGGDPAEPFRPEWFRFRLRPPTDYAGHDGYTVRVEPPGQFDGFSARYDRRGADRQFVVELRDFETRGTIIVPAVFEAPGETLPERLHCAFEVQVSRPGPFGETLRVAEQGAVAVPGSDD
jgi:hypothetical protein